MKWVHNDGDRGDMTTKNDTIMTTGTYCIKEGEWEAILDGHRIQATFNSKGAAEAGLAVERRRRARDQSFSEPDCGGVLGADGYSDADPGL